MSDSEELKRVVERLLRENNVMLKEMLSFHCVLSRIAAEFWAARLIDKEVADEMLVTGVDRFMLAAKLFNACRTSLVQHPSENFPKFIEVLKKSSTMRMLAEEMESEFEQARESYFNGLVATHLVTFFKHTYTIYIYPKIVLNCRC